MARAELHLTITAEPGTVEHLTALCEEMRSLRELVPEWHALEAEKITERFGRHMRAFIRSNCHV